jgi:hypothetical protein
VDRARRKVGPIAVAAPVGDEINGDGAPAEFLGQCESRKQMPAGPARGENDRWSACF